MTRVKSECNASLACRLAASSQQVGRFHTVGPLSDPRPAVAVSGCRSQAPRGVPKLLQGSAGLASDASRDRALQRVHPGAADKACDKRTCRMTEQLQPRPGARWGVTFGHGMVEQEHLGVAHDGQALATPCRCPRDNAVGLRSGCWVASRQHWPRRHQRDQTEALGNRHRPTVRGFCGRVLAVL